MISDPRIVIPILRSALPNLMAQQIVGVQPMNMGSNRLFKYEQSYLNIHQNKRYWPYRIVIRDWYDIYEAERFCYDNFRSRNWRNVAKYFYFKNQNDAALFTLKWGS
jgi:hypothetical protein